MEEGERDDDFLKVLRALRDAARSVEAGEDGEDGPALRALLALEAGADDLLAGDPELHPLCRLLATIRALSWCASEEAAGGGLRARCRRCKARRGIARAAGGVAAEIQAWADRELAARLVAALRGGRDGAPALELCLRVAYYGRREVLDALLAEGLVKRLLCLQRTATNTDTTDATDEEERSMAASAVALFAVQVEAGHGLRPREKRAAKLLILRRVREAAVSPAEEAAVLAEVLWGATP